MELNNVHVSHFKPSHKAKLWMASTIVVVLLGSGGVYYFVKKTITAKRVQKPAATQQATQQTVELSAEPATQAKQVSEELKDVNLAELQAAVKDIKDIVSAF